MGNWSQVLLEAAVRSVKLQPNCTEDEEIEGIEGSKQSTTNCTKALGFKFQACCKFQAFAIKAS